MIQELSDLIRAQARLWFKTADLSMNEELDPAVIKQFTATVMDITEKVDKLRTGELPLQDRLFPVEWA